MLYLFLFIYFKDREKKQLSQKLLDTITIKNATTVTCKKKKMFHNPFLISTGWEPLNRVPLNSRKV